MKPPTAPLLANLARFLRSGTGFLKTREGQLTAALVLCPGVIALLAGYILCLPKPWGMGWFRP